MDIREISYGGPGYAEMTELRERILRRPLGLRLEDAERRRDSSALLLGCFDGAELVGCLLLEKYDARWIKMRQVAVSETRQGQGIGGMMLEDAYARTRGLKYARIFCHARMTAENFYLKHDWRPAGGVFDEQGIPHRRMESPVILRAAGGA